MPRNREIGGVIRGDLKKNTAVRAAFVGLSRRVEEPRAETRQVAMRPRCRSVSRIFCRVSACSLLPAR